MKRFMDVLRGLLDRADGKAMTIGEILAGLGDQGTAMMIAFLSVPAMLPGLGTPFGLAMAVLGVRLAMHRPPWLPRRLLNRKLSYAELRRIALGTPKIWLWLEKIVRPRFSLFLRPGLVRLAGINIVLAALILAIPFPLPGSNIAPVIVIFIVAIGLIEGDGLFVLIGHVLTLLLIVFLFFIGNSAVMLWHKAAAWFA